MLAFVCVSVRGTKGTAAAGLADGAVSDAGTGAGGEEKKDGMDEKESEGGGANEEGTCTLAAESDGCGVCDVADRGESC